MKREVFKKHFTKFRDDYIVNQCKSKKVLHIGSCDWPYAEEKFKKGTLLHQKIQKVCKDQLGIDLDKESIAYLKKNGIDNIKYFDMNKVEKLDYKPDIIIFGETIEHIMNLETGLNNLKKIMTNDTKMIITTPNADAAYRIYMSLRGYEIQHPDHNVIFTYKTLEQLVKKLDFKVVGRKFTFKNNENIKFKDRILYFIGSQFPMFSSTLICVVKKNEK